MAGPRTWVYSLWLVLHLSHLIIPAAEGGEAEGSVAKPGCNDKCGDVMVPYPFGIDELSCAMNQTFLFTCDRSVSPPKLMFDTNHIMSISVHDSTIVVRMEASYYCYNGKGLNHFNQSLNFTSHPPFMLSETRNKFTAVGCDVLAMTGDYEGTYANGCASMCVKPMNLTKNSTCSGIGCCQTAIIKHVNALGIDLISPTDHNVSEANPCSYAFLLDIDSGFSLSDDIQTTSFPTQVPAPPVALDWVVSREQDCQGLCGLKADCVYSENALGYRCSCKAGYLGNPYLEQGCKDIDECKEPQKYPCNGTCKNTEGNYTCNCPLGMWGDGKGSCRLSPLITVSAVVGSTTFSIIISLLILIIFKKRRKQNNFMKNGGELLKNQRMRIFNEAELVKATKNYDKDQLLGEGGFGYVYKGVLEGNMKIAVKKPKSENKIEMSQDFLHEIATVSQVNHRNVVKLLGLCLETKVPLLVYEFISNGTLFEHIHDKTSKVLKSWRSRLRVVAEAALAIDYLHSAADPPIIHRDIKSMNILLDENYTAKVSDFGASVLTSPDQTVLATKVQGTLGYLDPEYLMTGILTEKSDVYSFGVLLVELLTGEKPTATSRSGEKRNIIQYFISTAENNDLFEILGFQVDDEIEKEGIQEVAGLARRCLDSSGIRRPTMKEVADELTRLKRFGDNFWAQQNGTEETEHLLDCDPSSHFDNNGETKIQMVEGNSNTFSSLDIKALMPGIYALKGN